MAVPSRTVVASDYPFNCWLLYDQTLQVFQRSYWHNEQELGWGNVQFADGHVGFTQAVLTPRPDGTSDHVAGPDYTFSPSR